MNITIDIPSEQLAQEVADAIDVSEAVREALANEGLTDYEVDQKIERMLEDYVRADDLSDQVEDVLRQGDYQTADDVRSMIESEGVDVDEVRTLVQRVEEFDFEDFDKRIFTLEARSNEYQQRIDALEIRVDTLDSRDGEDFIRLTERVARLEQELALAQESVRPVLNVFALVGKVLTHIISPR